MICRLCMLEYENCMDLYDDTGQQTKFYIITAKYFEKQLGDFGTKCSNVICSNCWALIYDFHNFQEIVWEHYERLMRFEEIGQLEMEIALEDVALSKLSNTDPVDIAMETKENLRESVLLNSSEDDDDDDKPLLKRLVPTKTVTRRIQCRKKITTRATKISKPTKTIYRTNNTKKITTTTDKSNAQQILDDDDTFIAQNWKNELPCGLCSQTRATFNELRKHFRDEHSAEKCYVICCDNKYYHRFKLLDHLQVHRNPDYFKCTQCGKCSANRRSLAAHLKLMHAETNLERQYECEVCNKRFTKLSILRGHMDIHATGSKDYLCKHCGKGFVLENRLNIHVRNVHSTSYCVCEQCGKSFRARHELKRHLLEHEGIMRRKWPCDQCDAQLQSKFSLGRHKRLAHHDGSTVYVCSECGKVALTEDALRSHKKYVHEKERKHICNICNKAFKVAVVLREHMTTHTGEDLYQCPHCPKTFKVNANMHHHRKRMHPKEWAENRQHRTLAAHIDLSQVSNEVLI